MTRDDIIRLAREVIPESAAFELKGHYEIERFVALVAAHEREANAPTQKNFDAWWDGDTLTKDNPYKPETPIWWAWEGWCAAIRARDQE